MSYHWGKATWRTHLAGKGTFAMAEMIIGNLLGYRSASKSLSNDTTGLSNAIMAIIELTNEHNGLVAALAEPFEARLKAALHACQLLVDAYRKGAGGGSIDWGDLDDAHTAARAALGLPETGDEETADGT
jgi:hypothetical protein